LSREEKYLILIVLLTLNSNMQVVFLHHPRYFMTAKLNGKNVYIYIFHWKTKFNFFGGAHGGKYLFIIELLTLNSNT
jgi:hypothetical protein